MAHMCVSVCPRSGAVYMRVRLHIACVSAEAAVCTLVNCGAAKNVFGQERVYYVETDFI